MAMMLMVTVYNLTLMMMSALMSYRSSCPIYHYRVNSSSTECHELLGLSGQKRDVQKEPTKAALFSLL